MSDQPDNPISTSPCKVLVKSGVWVVPENERPSNWKDLPIRDPVAHQAPEQPSGLPDAAVLDAVVEQHDSAANRPETEISQRTASRSAATRKRTKELRACILEFRLDEWAKEVCSAAETTNMRIAAETMLLGLWTRDPKEIARVLRASIRRVRRFAGNCVVSGLWSDDGGIVLPDFEKDPECSGVEFILNVLCVTGEAQRQADDNEQEACYTATSPR